MKRLFYSLVYLGILGIVSFPFGRILAHRRWNPEAFPFRGYKWEKEGMIYDKYLRIRRWKDRVPDVSKWVPNVVPKKTLVKPTLDQLDSMIQETCVAEKMHIILCFLSIPVLFIMEGVFGIVLFMFTVIFGNIPFALIQRYNRFRYMRIRRMCESSDFKR